MEESARNIGSRASAFRVVRPTCYPVSPLLAFHPQFWYTGGASFPYPPVSSYQEFYSSPLSAGHFVTPPNGKLAFCCPEAASSISGLAASSDGTGLEGHSSLTPLTPLEPEAGIVFSTVQAGQRAGDKAVPISSNPDVSSEISVSKNAKKKAASSNTTCPVCGKVFGRVTTLKVRRRDVLPR